MQESSINERISGIAAAAAASHQLEFVRSEVVGPKRNPTVRVYIDKPGGITLDECSTVSRAIEEVLDANDIISEVYTLEVSSPGLERELFNLSDFERFAGHKAKVKLSVEGGGRKSYSGRIVGVEDSEILFEDRTLGEVRFPFGSVAKANLRVDLEDEFKRRR